MNSRILFVPVGLYLALTLSGCSVAMALSGSPEPNFNAFEIGSTRKQVEIQLGTPVASQTIEQGKTKDTYQYEMGNAPNGHRATMNFYMDLATIGLWEFPMTIIEAMMGETHETQILYSGEDRVVAIEGYTPPPPSTALKEAREAQEKYPP